MSFVHLHLHTQYSLLDGAIRIADLAKKAKEFGMPACAITDHGSMFGSIEFYEKMNSYGVKPIIGCEVYIAPGSRFEKPQSRDDEYGFHLVLLCKDLAGYRNLSKLVSCGHREGFYRKPRIDREILRRHHDGLIALSACLKGEVAWHASAGRIDRATDAAQFYLDTFGDDYYLELQENGINEQDIANQGLLEIGGKLGINLVATNDCHYLNRDDAHAHEVLLCIQTGKTMDDPSRMAFTGEEFWFKDPDTMRGAFRYCPEACDNTLVIADKCDLKLDLSSYHFPRYEPKSGSTADADMAETARAGLEERLEEIESLDGNRSDERRTDYRNRLDLEIGCIQTMGFAGYFLVVADFINWAKDHGIPVGPGRGSAAGSLVAYAMRITDLDPIPYNLLFERFLNPERVSMPDIDIDFCQDRRAEVIEYVREKYGEERVSQIITFGTMAARGVIRDVGRALGLTFQETDRISKLIPETLGMTLEQALKAEPRLDQLRKEDARFRELVDIALRLEGLSRHASTHAAGVVIAPDVMEEFCPTYKDQKTGTICTQYAMKSAEKIGLVKFDFLGLKNLTSIHRAICSIHRDKDPGFDIRRIPMDDPATFELLQKGDTTGVFQLESSGMKDLLTRLKPTCFEDIIAVCALYRPGPLGSGMVDDFINRKHGRAKVLYPLPQLEPVLKDTYGVIVYQEQVMKIAQVLAGYSLGKADLLRRSMGKKDAAIMAKEKEPFLAGCRDNGVDEKIASDIFDLVAKFAEYGFNKSHSAAYALIAYQTAYLKAHYPVEFMAALLTVDTANAEKVQKGISECRDMGIEVTPPDINRSQPWFEVVGDKIAFSLSAVKQVGHGAIESIIEARQSGPFSGITEFCCRINLTRCNKRVIENLVKAGAFDSIEPSRARVMGCLDLSVEMAQKLAKRRNSAQLDLFGETIEDTIRNIKIEPPAMVTDWDEKLRLSFEKEVLGLYITGHPLKQYSRQIKLATRTVVADLYDMTEKQQVRVCGTVVGLKEIMTKKGERMAFINLEDLSGTIEVVVFSDVYKKAIEDLSGDEPLLVTAELEVDEESRKLMAREIVKLASAVGDPGNAIRILLRREDVCEQGIAKIKQAMQLFLGPTPAELLLPLADGRVATMRLPTTSGLRRDPRLAQAFTDAIGYNPIISVKEEP